MATLNYQIDTQPLATEMDNVSRSVNNTKEAVLSMQEAVVAAEERASDLVCDNINRGFYSLIRSQISQKLAKHKSDVDAKTMLLSHQKRAMINIRNQMERDYTMISKRYTKLFNGLNSNLKTRVFELDKPLIDFAYHEIGKISNRTKYLTATIPITQLESISESQKIISSNIKKQVANAIYSIKDYIREMNSQDKMISQKLVNDKNIPGNNYMPVAILESIPDSTGRVTTEIVYPVGEMDSEIKNSISDKIYNNLFQMEWSVDNLTFAEVMSEFSKLLSVSQKPDKVKETAMTLFRNCKYETAKGE
ncbi:MAG: hypothetical protein ACD_77C00257G0004 [uncultured bacterium]|nr:MAG: hypothetical protein ACD_77C00257G0004 [uncultured bacterium]HBY02405.1 hypothetical protein [Rikenellaceae bacterium]